MPKAHLPWLATIVAATILVACGGGGSDTPVTTPPPAGVAPPVVVPVCPASAMPSGAADTVLTMAAYTDRDYTLVLPSSYVCGQALAVVVVLHGGGGNKENMRRTACPNGDLTSAGCIDKIANAAGMAVVFPNGTLVPGSTSKVADGQRTWNAGGGQNGYICVSGNACNQDVDDIAYMRALVADVGTHVAVDPKRVFVSGFSDGAAMTQRLACQAADLFAAMASVSGENQFALAGCTPAQHIAVLDIHGTADACWPYAGGSGGCVESGLFVSVADTLAGWAGRNGCSAPATSTTLPAAARGRRRHQCRPAHVFGLRRGRRSRAPRGRRQRPLLAAGLLVFDAGHCRWRHERPAEHEPDGDRFLRRARPQLEASARAGRCCKQPAPELRRREPQTRSSLISRP